MSARRKRAYLFVLVAIAIWGASAPIAKFALNHFSPFAFLTYRFGITSLIGLIFFVFARPKMHKPWITMAKVAFVGVFIYSISLSLLFVGLSSSTVLDLTLISTVGPILVMLGGSRFLNDKITHREKVGAAIALAGVTISAIIPALSQGGLRLSGNIFLLMFLLVDSFATIIIKKLMRDRVEASVVSQGILVSSGFVFIGVGLFKFGVSGMSAIIMSASLSSHLSVFYMAILAGSVAHFLYFRGARSIEISETILFSYLQPVFAIPLAVVWLGEKITPLFVIGMSIIAIGVILAERKSRRS